MFPWFDALSLRQQLLAAAAVSLGGALLVDLLLLPLRWWFAHRSHTPRVADVLRVARIPAALSLVLGGLGLTLQRGGVDGGLWEVLRSLMLTAATSAWTWAAFRTLSLTRASLLENQDRWAFAKPQVLSLLDVAARALVSLLAAYCLMLAWGIDLSAWLAGAGVVGIAVGFAAKDILSNLIGGVTIIIEGPYKLGDIVEAEGQSGVVTYIGLRSTWLETFDGRSVVLPNSAMMSSTVVNLSGGSTPYRRAELRIPIPYGPDPAAVIPLIHEAIRRTEGVVLTDPELAPSVSPAGLGPYAMDYLVRLWSLSPGSTSRAATTNIYRLLSAAGVRFRQAVEELTPRVGDRPEVSGPLRQLSGAQIDALLLREAAPAPARTLVLSDLYLGDGGPQDVFAGAEALPDLLDGLAAEGPLRVIVNGNTLDFLAGPGPLVLDAERAVARARALVSGPGSAAVLRALGRVLAAGGEVLLRAGNHDPELLLPEVQEVVREALGQPPEIAGRLAIEDDGTARVLEIGGVRIALTHGHQREGYTRVDYEGLRSGRGFRYPPAAALARGLLSPLSCAHRMRFVDLLRPDFQGAAIAALAVDPGAVKENTPGGTRRLLWMFFRHRAGALSFAEGEALGPELGLSERVEDSGLSEGEQEALEALLGDGPSSFATGGEAGRLGRARVKLLRSGLLPYARARAEEGVGRAEWKEARRQAALSRAEVVLSGHTQVAGVRSKRGLLYVNTGSWSWQLRAPDPEAPAEEWERFLRALQVNPELSPRGGQAPIYTRLTAALLEAHPAGGVGVRLVEWRGGELIALGEHHIGTVPPVSCEL